MFKSRTRKIIASIKEEPAYDIMKWQILSRKTDYYKYRINNNPSIIEKIKYITTVQ